MSEAFKLPGEICDSGARVIEIAGVLRDHLNGLLTCDSAEAAEGIICEMKAVLCGLMAEGNRIKMLTGAAVMTGLVQRTAPVSDDEATRARFLESLHRAGDHTLDDEGPMVTAELALEGLNIRR